MRERDRIEVRQHREEVEARERAEREERERPIREAESELQKTAAELAKVYRARLLGEVKDPDRIPVDPAVRSVRMTQQQAAEFNAAEFRKFRAENPDLYFPDELLESVGCYFDKNGLKIITSSMLASLIERYAEAGLLPERPAPEPEATPEPEEPKPPAPQTFKGIDPATGLEREYTAREVDRMSSDEYRRVFRIYAEHLILPNVGPGPTARKVYA